MKKQIQSVCEEVGKYGCLALCYAEVVLDVLNVQKEVRDNVALSAILGAYKDGTFIEDEFFVKNPVGFMQQLAKSFSKRIKCNVTKQPITSYKDLPETGYACVRHDYNGKSHWVLSKNQSRIFDSLDDSYCVKNGKPTSARVITIEVLEGE